MTSRRRQQRSPLDRVIEMLPARFLSGHVRLEGGAMVGLRDYMADLGNRLRVMLGTNDPPVVAVMHAIGCPPSAWYAAAFGVECADELAQRRRRPQRP